MRSDPAWLSTVALQSHRDPAGNAVVCAGLELTGLRDAWRSDACVTAGLSGWLAADELRQFARFPVQKRQLEWLAGRLAAKQALNHYRLLWDAAAEPDWPAAAILRQDDGRPYVADAHTYLSISHNRSQAVAAVSNCPVGIDVESFGALQLGSVADLLGEAEVAAVRLGQGCDASQARTLIWCLKEALFKACGRRAFVPFARAVRLQSWPAGQAPCWAVEGDSREIARCDAATPTPACRNWQVQLSSSASSAQVLVYRKDRPEVDKTNE
ncbi:4'-phosphopantetheinyl transferase superfamily protein [Chitinimonas arctica]|uniref:Enterobactin synthase component D n=1 Tax=Chitinimonas arctica TaxID=2594795 RepID=A0A516SCS3_9NEIS|nr:4'-phosphopantetheinyl transferase superfamily protein [Chitinimonas arctica]QDQ25953.1 4'-phosphopantetheinyl transferase superfamily protein [Chitinimonas arctica]